jgi:hypothetical protein
MRLAPNALYAHSSSGAIGWTIGPVGVDHDDRRELGGVAARALALVRVVVLALHLDQDRVVDAVALHLEQQHLDRLVPAQGYVTVAVDDRHRPGLPRQRVRLAWRSRVRTMST